MDGAILLRYYSIDNMTSVHDDVIGAVVAALFLWLSIRL
jgi:hypothetical protein